MNRLKKRYAVSKGTPRKYKIKQARTIELVNHLNNGGCVIEKKSDEVYTRECLTPQVIHDLMANPDDYEILPYIKGIQK